VNDATGERVVSLLGEAAARELLEVLERPDADRAALIARLQARDDAACLLLLTACGGAPATDRPSSPSPTPGIEEFHEQWCLAVDSLEASTAGGPFVPGNDAAISDLTVTADSLDRLVSDLQDARLSAPASEIRSLAATVREYIAAIDAKGTSADDIIASFDGQTRALKRMSELSSRWERCSDYARQRLHR
jgi:hypothetical protein